METIKEQMERIVDGEREKNNLVLTPLKKRHKTPEKVAKAKVEYVLRRIQNDGIEINKAIAEAGMSKGAYYRFSEAYGYREKRRSATKEAAAKKRTRGPDRKPRRGYTEMERAEYVKRFQRLIATRKALTQTHAASMLGVTQSALSRWSRMMKSKRLPHIDNGRTRKGKELPKQLHGSVLSTPIALGKCLDIVRKSGTLSTTQRDMENAFLRAAMGLDA
jgi:hypothetical protein